MLQPGDFPRGWGGWAGVPITAITPAIACATRPGLNFVLRLCQGRGRSVTISRANHSCQVISGIKSLHRSHCFGVLNLGNVQCKRCLMKRYQWSTAKRRRYNRQTSVSDGISSPTQANHIGFIAFPVRWFKRSTLSNEIECPAALRKCKFCHRQICTRPN